MMSEGAMSESDSPTSTTAASASLALSSRYCLRGAMVRAPSDRQTSKLRRFIRRPGLLSAWRDWMERHSAQLVEGGGPLGKTKKVSRSGVADVRNNLAGYVVIEADSLEAAAAMFKDHPHFSIFPGDGVEIMPVLPIPGR